MQLIQSIHQVPPITPPVPVMFHLARRRSLKIRRILHMYITEFIQFTALSHIPPVAVVLPEDGRGLRCFHDFDALALEPQAPFRAQPFHPTAAVQYLHRRKGERGQDDKSRGGGIITTPLWTRLLCLQNLVRHRKRLI